MATKTRSSGRAKTETASPRNGLVLRAIRDDAGVNEQVEYLLQQFGEFYFGVERIEDLDREDRHGWIKFSTTVGKAHHNLTRLAEVMEEAIKSEVSADLRLVQAEIETLEKRQSEDALHAAAKRARREARADAAEKRAERMLEEDLADRKQKREMAQASGAQDLVERETRRKIYRVRESVLIGITVFCVLLAAFLIVLGVTHDKLIFIGGSGVSATLAIGGFAKLVFGWGDPSAPPSEGTGSGKD